MSAILLLDFVCLLAYICAAVFLILKRHDPRFRDTGWILLGLLSLRLIRDISNIYQWSGLSSYLESIEDYPGILEPLFWGFLVYAFLQAAARRRITEREQQYRLLAENSTDVIMTLDLQANVTYVSPSIKSAIGYSPAEIIGKPIYSILNHGTREIIAEVIAEEFRHLDDPSYIPQRGSTFNLEVPCRDGSLVWVEISRSFIRDERGVPVGILASARDVTKRQLAEQQLQDSEEKFSKAFQYSPLMMALSSLADGRFLEVNDQFCEFTGYSREEALGLTSPDRGMLSDETRQTMLESLAEYGFYSNNRLLVHTNDGAKRHVQFYAVPVTIARHQRLLTVALDITDQVKAERDRAVLEDRLSQTQKLEAIGTLAGGIAHDFNNILFAILGNTEIALADTPPDSPAHSCLSEIKAASHRAADLVRQILSFARQSEMRLEQTLMAPVVTEVLKLVRSTLPSQIEVVTRIEAPAAAVLGDSTQLHQLLMNLCANSIQAMREGGGKLRVTLSQSMVAAAEARVHPQLTPGPYVRLEVADTGHGIPAKVRHLIFEPFFSTKEVGEGTGLGLSVVHGIVTSMHGAINVHSEPGAGTTFEVFLPAIETAVAGAEVETTRPVRGSEHVMLVEDEESVARAAELMLQDLGYAVSVFRQSNLALAAFRECPAGYDLVLTDLAMPELNGRQLAAELLKVRADIPVILYTGYAFSLTDEQMVEAGIRECLIKPFTQHKLADAVRRALAR